MRVGDVVAERFELETLIGSGGMGDVHRAIDRTTGARVAIKSLRAHGGDVDRFLREARILEELAHPAIVRHVAHGESRGDHFLAMEWLEGEDLATRLHREPLTVAESLTLVTRVAEALAVVHARGVLHRDLKPSNLFLPGGVVEQVKVLDFGIARVAGIGARTITGTTLGTPGYMAPEQARGDKTVDARADVFALGCVLFECLSGRPAFTGDHPVAILGKILFEEAPRLREVRPEVSPDLDALVARLLSKDPSHRPADGGALYVELLTIGTQSGAAPKPSVHPPMLTDTGQRLLSVVMAREPTGARDASTNDAHAATMEMGATDDGLARLRAIANRYGARIDRVGDGTLVAVVAVAGSATDQSASAARLALDLHAAMPRACVVAATGRGVVSDRWPVGDAIERGAALLRELEGAPPSDVTIDSTTAGLVESRFDLHRGEAHISLLRERSVDSTRLLLGRPSPCVGRDREISMLETIVAESAQESVARAVLVTAPPGAGKSRLLSELLRRIDTREGAPQRWIGRADATRAGSPFALLAPLLRATIDVREGEPLADRRQRVRARVARHVEAAEQSRVAEFVGEIIGVSFPESPGSALQAARRDAQLMSDQMARAFEDLVDAELRAGPLLVALEDVHWGDLPSLTFLDRVLRNSKHRPLTVIAMARPEVRETFPKLWAERDVTEVRLAGLSPRAAERLVRSVLGDSFDPARVAAIVERADGNAFYLEELIRAESEGRNDALPETVLAMVQMRLEALSDDERRALRAASIFGETFWDGGVRALVGQKTTTATTMLRSLVDRETVQPVEPSRFPGEREYRFRHAIVRQAAYALLTDTDRALGHRLAAQWLTKVSEHDAAALAEHHRRGGAMELAVACYLRAADQALDANDLANALARADDGIACGASGRELGELLRVQAEVHRWSGRMIEAATCGAEAMDRLEPGSIGWCKAAEAGAQTPVVEGSNDDHARTDRLVTRLLEVEPREDAAAHLCVAMCMLARSMFLLSRFDVGRRLNARIEPLVQSLGGDDHFVEAQFAQMRAVWARMEGDTSRAVHLNEIAIAEYEALGAIRQVLFVKGNLADCLLQLAEWKRAIEVVRPVVPAAQKMGLDSVAIIAGLNLAIALAQVGEIDEALTCVDEAMRLSVARGNRRYQCIAQVYRADVLEVAGRFDSAADAAREAATITAEFPPIHPQALGLLAHIELRRDHVDEALQLSARAMEMLNSIGSLLEGAELVRVTYATALYRSGKVEEAKRVIADARDRLLRSAALIGDATLREGFLRRVAANAETLRRAEEWLD